MIAGGIVVGRRVQCMVRDAQAQQKQLCADVSSQQARGSSRKSSKIAVNRQFFKRLLVILSMYVSPRDGAHVCLESPGCCLVKRCH